MRCRSRIATAEARWPFHGVRQGGEVGALPVVHRQGAGRIQQGASRDGHDGIIRERERPRLAEVCHDQIGRSF